MPWVATSTQPSSISALKPGDYYATQAGDLAMVLYDEDSENLRFRGSIKVARRVNDSDGRFPMPASDERRRPIFYSASDLGHIRNKAITVERRP